MASGGGESGRMKEGGGWGRSNGGRWPLPGIDLFQSGMAGRVMKCEIWRERPRARRGRSGGAFVDILWDDHLRVRHAAVKSEELCGGY